MDDGRQVPVVQPDRVEPAVPVLQEVEQAGRDRARGVPADQVAQVPLAVGTKLMIGAGRPYSADSTSLETFCASLADLVRMADVRGEPQHEFVEHQHDRVVAKDFPGVLADDGQALVQGEERLGLGPYRPRIPAERSGQQVADEPSPIFAARRFGERDIQRRWVPGGCPTAPLGSWAMNFSSPSLPRSVTSVGDQLVVPVYSRQRGAGVKLADLGDVTAQDGGVQRRGARSCGEGTSRNFLPRSHRSCRATTWARPFLPRASGSPRRIACSTAMKCDLPEPNDPSR